MNEKEFRAMLARNGETAKDLANALGMAEGTLSAKIRGILDFWRREIMAIKIRYNLSDDEVIRIFFALEVPCKCTTDKEVECH